MTGALSFPAWLKRRRRVLELTQSALAVKAYCSTITIKKIESGDLMPSRQLAGLIGTAVGVPAADQEAFVRFARDRNATAAESDFSNSTQIGAVPSPEHVPLRVPAQLTALIGREHDLEAASAVLRQPGVRLLTLTGPPGTGKTRLALAIGERLQDSFRDGACFVPLATATDAESFVAAVARALNIRDSQGRDPRERVSASLRDKHVLLILDNFEQLLTPAGADHMPGESPTQVVADLLSLARNAQALVTSREPLKLYGEREFPVAPLDLPQTAGAYDLAALAKVPSVALFLDRAQSVNQNLALSHENADSIARLCTWLDGLPLAIEMAAARVKYAPPSVLLAQLRNRLSSLSSSTRDVPLRQQTMRGAIDWSYELLSADEKRMFEVLGVFAGGADDASVLAVQRCWLGGVASAEAEGLLMSLVDRSLLRRDFSALDPRCAMLDTLRDYARQKLAESGQLEQVRRCHAQHFLEVAQAADAAMGGDGDKLLLDRLERDHDNLRAALASSIDARDAETSLRLCASLGAFWQVRGYMREGLHATERALELSRGLHEPELLRLRAGVLNVAGRLLVPSGDLETAQRMYEESLALSRQLGDKRAEVQLLLSLGALHVLRRDWPTVLVLAEDGVPTARDIDDRRSLAELLSQLGRAASETGRHEQARDYLETSLSISRALGDPRNVALALNNLGNGADTQGDFEAGYRYLAESLAIRRELGDAYAVNASLNNMGSCCYLLGDYDEAELHLVENLARSRQMGDKLAHAWALRHLGMVWFGRGDMQTARQFFQEALEFSMRAGGQIRAAHLAREGLALVSLAEGEYDAAEQYCAEPLAAWRASNYFTRIAEVERSLGLARLGKGDFEQAAELLDHSLRTWRIYTGPPYVAAMLVNVAYLDTVRGRVERAAECLSEAMAVATSRKPRQTEVLARLAAAFAASRKGDAEAAQRLRREADELASRHQISLGSLPRMMRDDFEAAGR